MGNNTVSFTIDVNGNLAQSAKEATTLNQQMQQATAASKRVGGGSFASAAAARIGRGTFGGGGGDPPALPAGLGRGSAAGNARGDSRDFARQAQGLGGLVHLYATFAANVFAVSTAFTALSKAMDVSRMEKALTILSERGGQSLKNMAKDMYRISDGALSMVDSMRFASMGSAAKIASKDMSQLANIAKGASIALGRDMGDAMDRLVRGVTKLEPELIDELGILVKAQEAYKRYATVLGISVDNMSSAQKSQAYLNAVLDEGTRKWASLANEMGANPFAKLLSGLKDMGTTILNVINSILGPIVELISSSKGLIFGLIAGITAKLATMAIPTLTAGRSKYLKEVSDLVSEQNTIRDKQERLINGSILAQQRELHQKMAAERGTFEKEKLAKIQGLSSKVGLNKVGTEVGSLTNLRQLTKDKATMAQLTEREEAIKAKIVAQEARLAEYAKKGLDAESSKVKASERALTASKAQLVNAEMLSVALKDQSATLTKMQAQYDNLGRQKQVVQPSPAELANKKALRIANAKENYVGGEVGFGTTFKTLTGEADGAFGKVKAGAGSLLLFAEKWSTKIFGALLGWPGMVIMALVAAWEPFKKWIGMTSEATKAVDDAMERTTEQVNRGAAAYSRMHIILAEVNKDSEQLGANLIQFNIAATTQLSESLNELANQARKIQELRAEAAKGDKFGFKGRQATEAETDLKGKTSKALTDFESSASSSSAAQTVGIFNNLSGLNTSSIADMRKALSTIASEDLPLLVSNMAKAGIGAKGFAVGLEEAAKNGQNMSKDFGANFDKFMDKKNFDHIAPAFQGLVSDIDTLDSKIAKLSGKGLLNPQEQAVLITLQKERAEALKGMLESERFRKALTEGELKTLQTIVDVTKASEKAQAEELDWKNKLTAATKETVGAATQYRDLSGDALENSKKMGLEVDLTRSNFSNLYSAASSTMAVIGDKNAPAEMRLNAIKALDDIIKRMEDLGKAALQVSEIEIMGRAGKNSQDYKDLMEMKGLIENSTKVLNQERVAGLSAIVQEATDKGLKFNFRDAELGLMAMAEKSATFLGKKLSEAAGAAAPALSNALKKVSKDGDEDKSHIKLLKERLELEKLSESLYKSRVKDAEALGRFDSDSVEAIKKSSIHQVELNYQILIAEAALKSNVNTRTHLVEVAKAQRDIGLQQVELELRANELLRAKLDMQKQSLQYALEDASIADKRARGESTLSDGLTGTLRQVDNAQKTGNATSLEEAASKLEADYSKAIFDNKKAELDIERELYNLKREGAVLSLEEIAKKQDAYALTASTALQQASILESKIEELNIAAELKVQSAGKALEQATTPDDQSAANERLKNAQREQAAVTRLNSPLQKLAKSYKDLGSAASKAYKEMNGEKAFARFLRDINNLGKSFGRLGKSFKELSDVFKNALGREQSSKIAAGLGKIHDILEDTSETSAKYFKESASYALKKHASDNEIFKLEAEADKARLANNITVLAAKLQSIDQEKSKQVDWDTEKREIDNSYVQSNLDNIGAMSAATASMFQEGSKEAKIFYTIQTTMLALKMALQVKDMAIQTANFVTTMAQNLTSTTTGIAAGVAQLFAQGGWAGFVGAAAFIAIMASLGKSGGGGGASAPSMSEQRQESQGKGTVFGDPEAKSESLKKSKELWKSDILEQTEQGNVMISLLASIDRTMSGIGTNFVGTLGRPIAGAQYELDKGDLGSQSGQDYARSRSSFGSTSGKGLAFLSAGGSLLNNIAGSNGTLGKAFAFASLGGSKIVNRAFNDTVGKLFGRKTSRAQIDGGIRYQGTVGDARADEYAVVRTTDTRKKWGKKKTTTYDETFFQENDELSKGIGNVFRGIGQSIITGVDILGFKTEAAAMGFADAVNNINLGTNYVSLQGVAGNKVNEVLQNAISAKSDVLVETALNGISDSAGNTLASQMKELRQVGEGLFETFQRVAAATQTSTAVLRNFGITMDPKSWLELDAGDAGIEAESLVKGYLAGNISDINTSLAQVFNQITGSVEELITWYSDLRDANDALKASGLSGDFSFDTLAGAGNFGNLQKGLSVLRDGNAQQEFAFAQSKVDRFDEKLNNKSETGGGSLAEAGYGIGATIADINANITELDRQRQLIDTSSASGAALAKDIDYVIGVNIAAAESVQALEEAEAALEEQTRNTAKMILDFMSQVEAAFNNYFESMNVSSNLKGLASDFASSMLSLSDSYADTKKGLQESLSGPELASAMKQITDGFTLASEMIIRTLLQKVSNAIDENKSRFEAYSGEGAGLGTAANSASNSQVMIGDMLESTLGAGFDLSAVTMPSLLDWSEQASRDISAQVAAGVLDPVAGERALTTIGAAVDAKFKLLDALKEVFDFQLEAAETLKGRLSTVQGLIKGNKGKASELRDQIGGDGVVTNRLADLDADIADSTAKYAAAIGLGDTEQAVELASELNDMVLSRFDLEMENLDAVIEKQMEYYENTKTFLSEVNDYVKGLDLSENSTLSIKDKLDQAQANFQSNLAIAQDTTGAYSQEDVFKARENLTSSADELLGFAKEYGASGTLYQQIFDSVKTGLGGLDATLGPTVAVSPEEQRNELMAAQIATLDGMNAQLATLETAISTELNDTLALLSETLQKLATEGFPLDSLTMALSTALGGTAATDLLTGITVPGAQALDYTRGAINTSGVLAANASYAGEQITSATTGTVTTSGSLTAPTPTAALINRAMAIDSSYQVPAASAGLPGTSVYTSNSPRIDFGTQSIVDQLVYLRTEIVKLQSINTSGFTDVVEAELATEAQSTSNDALIQRLKDGADAVNFIRK